MTVPIFPHLRRAKLKVGWETKRGVLGLLVVSYAYLD